MIGKILEIIILIGLLPFIIILAMFTEGSEP